MSEILPINPFYSILIACAVVLIFFLYKKRDASSAGTSSTSTLNSFSTDFTMLAKTGRIDPVIGREDEVKKLIQVLARRNKNNVILVGSPGVGKTAIVEGLAQRIISGEVPEHLLTKRVLALDVANLMSGTKYRGEFEQRAKKIVKEIISSNRSIILFIDEIHSVIQSKGTEGAVNFTDILKPELARGDLQMIGATTTDEYNMYIKPDSSLERRFQPIEISEPTEKETITILKGIQNKFKEYHNVEFTDAALETAVLLTNKLIKGRKLPDKAIDAIDESAAMVKVAHLHTAIPAMLYQAAVTKYPEIATLWNKIQKLDSELIKKDNKKSVAQREILEEQLAQRGVVIVDSDDVEKVVKDWTT